MFTLDWTSSIKNGHSHKKVGAGQGGGGLSTENRGRVLLMVEKRRRASVVKKRRASSLLLRRGGIHQLPVSKGSLVGRVDVK